MFRNACQSLIRDYLDGIVSREYALASLSDMGGSVSLKPEVEAAKAAVLKYRQRFAP